MNYIKLHHEIWNYDLSANAFNTYSALLLFMNTDTWYTNVSAHKLASAVGLSEKSIYRGISELQSKKLLSVVERHHNGHRLANGYCITPLSGMYTKLPVAALSVPVSSSGFMTFAYILKCVDSKFRAFPSLTKIATTIGIAVKTVVEQIKSLVKLKLLKKANQKKKDGSFGHNLYQVIDFAISYIKKEKTRLHRVSPQKVAEATSKCKISVLLKRFFVNTFSKIKSTLRGYLHFV